MTTSPTHKQHKKQPTRQLPRASPCHRLTTHSTPNPQNKRLSPPPLPSAAQHHQKRPSALATLPAYPPPPKSHPASMHALHLPLEPPLPPPPPKKIPHSGPDRGSASGGIIQTPRHHRHGLCPSRPVSTLIRSGGGGGPCPSDPDPRTRSLPAGVMRRSVRSVGQFGIYVHAHPPPLMGDGFGKCGGPGGGSMVQSWRQG